jgi:hypothetical protein
MGLKILEVYGVGKRKGVSKCFFKMYISHVLLEELGGHIFILFFHFFIEKLFVFFDLLEDLGVHIFFFSFMTVPLFFWVVLCHPKME